MSQDTKNNAKEVYRIYTLPTSWHYVYIAIPAEDARTLQAAGLFSMHTKKLEFKIKTAAKAAIIKDLLIRRGDIIGEYRQPYLPGLEPPDYTFTETPREDAPEQLSLNNYLIHPLDIKAAMLDPFDPCPMNPEEWQIWLTIQVDALMLALEWTPGYIGTYITAVVKKAKARLSRGTGEAAPVINRFSPNPQPFTPPPLLPLLSGLRLSNKAKNKLARRRRYLQQKQHPKPTRAQRRQQRAEAYQAETRAAQAFYAAFVTGRKPKK